MGWKAELGNAVINAGNHVIDSVGDALLNAWLDWLWIVVASIIAWEVVKRIAPLLWGVWRGHRKSVQKVKRVAKDAAKSAVREYKAEQKAAQTVGRKRVR